jgi:hypothetical protein
MHQQRHMVVAMNEAKKLAARIATRARAFQ